MQGVAGMERSTATGLSWKIEFARGVFGSVGVHQPNMRP